MIKSSITISLVNEARGGPFVYWDDIRAACKEAKELGFTGIEIFAPGPEVLTKSEAAKIVADHGLQISALGTGGGWVLHKWTLTSPEEKVRVNARNFIASMIEAGAPFGAPAIIGSLQGRHSEAVDPLLAHSYLEEALDFLSAKAKNAGTFLLFEPLNRYESNLVRTIDEGMALVNKIGQKDHLKLLCDLFHMNIEEADIAASLIKCGTMVGHVHLADSNRKPAGLGHTDFGPISLALKQIGYRGYVSAEALPLPDSSKAARHTIDCFNRHFKG